MFIGKIIHQAIQESLNFNGNIRGLIKTDYESGRAFCEVNGGQYVVTDATTECLDTKGFKNEQVERLFEQDTNQHQIILNAIASEAQCNAFLRNCKITSQDFNVGTETIVCKVNT